MARTADSRLILLTVMEFHLVKALRTRSRHDCMKAAALDKETAARFESFMTKHVALKDDIVAQAALYAKRRDAAKALASVKSNRTGEYNFVAFESLFKHGDRPLSGMGRDWYVDNVKDTTDLKFALKWEGLLTLDEEPGIDRAWYEARWHATEHANIFRHIEDARRNRAA